MRETTRSYSTHFRVGTHIMVIRSIYNIEYQHHGIVCEEGFVSHFCGTSRIMRDAMIKKTTIDVFQGEAPEINIVSWCTDQESLSNTLKRIDRSLSGEEFNSSYNIVTNNCEHYATWCMYGRASSDQVNDVFSRRALSNLFNRLSSYAYDTTINVIDNDIGRHSIDSIKNMIPVVSSSHILDRMGGLFSRNKRKVSETLDVPSDHKVDGDMSREADHHIIKHRHHHELWQENDRPKKKRISEESPLDRGQNESMSQVTVVEDMEINDDLQDLLVIETGHELSKNESKKRPRWIINKLTSWY